MRPKIVLSRHLAKSPGSWPSRQYLLGQCDALVAVSHFVAKVLREGDADPESDNPERHYRPPLLGDHSKIHVVYGGFDMDRFKPMEVSAQRAAWGLKMVTTLSELWAVTLCRAAKGSRNFCEQRR